MAKTGKEADGIDTDGTGNENQEKNSDITQLSTAIQPKMPCSEIHVDCPPKKTHAETIRPRGEKGRYISKEMHDAKQAAEELRARAIKATLECGIVQHGISQELKGIELSQRTLTTGVTSATNSGGIYQETAKKSTLTRVS